MTARVVPPGADCANCPLSHPEASDGPVLAKPNPRARLAIVGQEPGPEECLEGEPFIGRSGRLLNRSLEDFGINRYADTYVTNARLCLPRRKLTPEEDYASYTACRQRLYNELDDVQARVILAFGAGALTSLTGHRNGIFKWFGGPQYGTTLSTSKKASEGERANFFKWLVVPTLHPAYCLRAPAYTPVMQTHMLRAWRLAEGKLKLWKWPEFNLEPDAGAVRALKRILKSKRKVALDVETAGVNPLTDTLRVVGVSNVEDTVSLPWNAYTSKRAGTVKSLWEYEHGEELYELVKKILETKALVLQNGQHDIMAMHSQTAIRIPDEHYAFDTLLAHAVVAPRLNHYLDHIATVEFHMPMWKTEFGNSTDQKGAEKFFNRPELETRDYNAKDAYMTALLEKPLSERLDETHRGWEQFALLMSKMKVAKRMTVRGIMVDPSRFSSHRKHFIRKAAEARRVVAKIAGWKVNPNAHAQTHKLFFEQFGVQPKKYSEETGAPSLDESVLSDFLHHQDDRVKVAARGLLYFRRWDKLRGTYIDGLPYDTNNVVHAEWKVYGTRTGRWSSSPNLQNIPKPRYKTLKSGKKVVEIPGLRDIFVARPGYTFIEYDYKALELRIATLLSGDPLFLENFATGTDPHRDTAARIFGKDPKDITKDERDMSKIANYQMIYGGSPIELWKTITIDYPNVALWTVERLHEKWFDLHRIVYGWQQEQIRFTRRDGYVECPFSGRRQYYLDGDVDVNECLNFPVQGTGADIIDPAVVKIDGLIDWDSDAILLQGHDALLLETRDVEKLRPLVEEAMTTTLEYKGRKMTFEVEPKAGTDWANMTELK